MIAPADMALLASLPALAFQAVLLFCRMGAAVLLLPGLGEQEVPATLRLTLGVLLVPLLLPVLSGGLPPPPEALGEAISLIATEILVGIWIGTLARFISMALAQAGQIIATMIGLTSPLQGDVDLGAQATVLGRALGAATTVLILATGLYAIPLAAMVHSYTVLPVGAPMAPAAESIARAAGDSLEIALRLAAPFVLGAILFNVGLGLISRLAPQVQIFVVAAPAQILAGTGLLMLLLPLMIQVWHDATQALFLGLPGAR